MPNNGFDEWGGYMEAKITKLEEQFASASNPFRQSNLFAGISIFVNGLTNPSSDELKRIMMVHGGTYHTYERSHTTYIIASNLPDVKVRNMDTSKIISAQWVVDCVKANRILDYTNYLLYTNQRQSQPKISFGAQKKTEKIESSISEENKDEQVVNILKDLKDLNAKMAQPPLKNEPDSKLDTSKAAPRVARTAVDPKFLSEFYNNSRLHHIATLGAGFKQYISDLREEHSGEFPARQTLHEHLPKQDNFVKRGQTVMHIDMDCFFVSVGLRSYPHLRGQPIAVTHSKGGSADVPVHPDADRKVEMELFRKKFETQLHNNILSDKVQGGFEGKVSLSEIASCSYEARQKGIHNGMFVGQALKLCPNLQTIPYDFEGYKEVAYTLYNTIGQYTLDIEAVSCDEMYVNLTQLINELQVDPMDFVTYVREEVRRKTACPCSAGVGANKLQARMATKKAKPDGQFHLKPEEVEDYMRNIPIGDLPGVGSSTTYTLEQLNLKTCGDLQTVSLLKLQAEIGKKFGETLHQFCRGIDTRPLVYGQVRKSVSAEVNYGIRFKEYSELEVFLRQLCAEVHTRLSDIKRKGKCITLKVMVRAKEAPVETSKFMGHGVCDYITKAVSLSDYTCDLETITRTILTTMKALNLPPHELRGLGIQITKLNEPNEHSVKRENVIKNMFSKVVEKQKEKPQSAEAKVLEKSKENPQNSEANVTAEPNAIKNMFSKVVGKQKEKPQSAEAKVLEKPKENPQISEANITAEPNRLNESSKPTSPPKASVSSKSKKGRTTKKSAKTPNVMGMLQTAAMKRPAQPQSNLPDDIDPSVLAELPEDIRNEILREQARARPKAPRVESPQKRSSPESASNANDEEEFLRAMPPELRKEVEMQMGTKSTPSTLSISPDNIFHQKERMRLLLDWVKSTDSPENYDVELITEHAKEFVRAKKIHDLYDPMVYLFRIIERFGNCGWHTAYRVLVDGIQVQMRVTYEKKLFLRQIECKSCSVN